ncbi:ABC transporter permease [Vibrio sp. Vb339]|uniref:ABC transporter permease n=1 Tax=Vibrio sp. Vb339 TaxID=1192013 RepID=UPI001552B222|nr:ABC transporter permease [Vibrio sp. Vb339]
MNHSILTKFSIWLHSVFGIFMIVFLVMPLISVVPLSFSSSSFLSYPLPSLSMKWYSSVFEDGPWMSSLLNSLYVGVSSTFIATVLGTLAAFGLSRNDQSSKTTIKGLLLAPMIIPPVITGLGMYLLFGQLGLSATFPGLIIAHTVLVTPFVIVTVGATLKTFDKTLLQAASSLGASPVRGFFTVALPLIAPGVLSGALFAFVTSFDEVVVTLFISGPAQRTLPRQMFDGIRDNINPSIIAMSVFLMIVAVIALSFYMWLENKDKKNH